MNLLYNLLICAYYFIPVWGYVAWTFKVNGRKWVVSTEILLAIFALIFFLHPLRISKISSWIPIYMLFLMLYVEMFTAKMGNFAKGLAVSLWTIFVAADYWELPVFTYDFVGLVIPPLRNHYSNWLLNFTWNQWYYSHIHRLYVIVSFVLFVWLAHFRFNRRNLGLLAIGTLVSFYVLYPYWRVPYIDIIARAVTLAYFGVVVYLGLKTVNDNSLGVGGNKVSKTPKTMKSMKEM